MKYPDGEFSQVGYFMKIKFYELKARIVGKKGKSLIYMFGVGAPQKWS